MPGHGAREHAALDVPSLARERLGGVVMAHGLHILLDDRTLVQILGHVMGGGADQFYAARMRLMIRLRALESRQERGVDVDALPRQFAGELVRENLHVAGPATCNFSRTSSRSS